jgi:hypothetical protein
MHKAEMHKAEMHKAEMHKAEMHKAEMHKRFFGIAASTLIAAAIAAGIPAPAQAELATDKNIGTMIGRHFWPGSFPFTVDYCPPGIGCPKIGDFLGAESGFIVLGIAHSEAYGLHITKVKVKLDDGRIGYIEPGIWLTDSPAVIAGACAGGYWGSASQSRRISLTSAFRVGD